MLWCLSSGHRCLHIAGPDGYIFAKVPTITGPPQSGNQEVRKQPENKVEQDADHCIAPTDLRAGDVHQNCLCDAMAFRRVGDVWPSLFCNYTTWSLQLPCVFWTRGVRLRPQPTLYLWSLPADLCNTHSALSRDHKPATVCTIYILLSIKKEEDVC